MPDIDLDHINKYDFTQHDKQIDKLEYKIYNLEQELMHGIINIRSHLWD